MYWGLLLCRGTQMALEAVGHNGTVVWDGQWVTIDRERAAKGKGAWGTSSRTAGRGEKRFAVASITAIQILLPHDGANPWQNGLGYIEFSFSGGVETKGMHFQLGTAAVRQMRKNLKNENAVMFGKDQKEAFIALKAALEREIGEPGTAKEAVDPTSASSVGDELTKIAGLYQKGLLSQSEFDEAKTNLLHRLSTESPT
jgi:hypothetical protein